MLIEKIPQNQSIKAEVTCMNSCMNADVFLHKKLYVRANTQPNSLISNKSFWTPRGSRKGPMKKGLSIFLSVLLSILPFFCLSFCPDIFLEIYHQFFLNFGMVLDTCMKLCLAEQDFLEKKCAPKIGKMDQRWAKNRVFFNLFKNLVINFYWICCMLFAVLLHRSHIWENVPEIWAKMCSTNQVAGLFNQSYLQNKSVKQPDFLHVHTNSHKLHNDQEIFGWA